ncbi:MAG: PD-(D/E)XK nuclease family protein [Lachnospiraceae bacterium]|nr:PD-(D/E)XK nuclease family protein [Lachnospiraceae bacterium]
MPRAKKKTPTQKSPQRKIKNTLIELTGKSADYLAIYNLDKPDGSKIKIKAVDDDSLQKTREHILKAAHCIHESNLPRKTGSKCDTCYMKKLCGK